MEIAAKYSSKDIEPKWYEQWMNKGFFKSVPNEKEPFTIVIPPPNVTGVLHMGHMLNNTIQDVLIRRARMLGYNACWVPGTDHASIATEAKVVNLLREKGITKADISREEFLKYAYEWKDKYGGIILDQLKKLGSSCDWDRTRFTMEPKLNEAVIKCFVDLYNRGYIYKDWKIVNWDPKAQTTLSNEEVIRKEENAKLYYVKYAIKDSNEYITIATTRPETIMGDTAVCVHPDDERYKHLVGKKAIVPLVEREVPIIADDYIDMEFGTGCLKVTPAHDINDYEIGQKHQLETIDTLNDDGTLNEKAQIFVGEDRFVARKKVAKLLEEKQLLVKVEDITHNVGYSERNPDTVVEPKLSLQWFVKMDDIVKPALDCVMNDEIKFYPEKFKNIYKHWLDNIRDWPISRQLWWGQQIPAYYYNDKGDFVVAENLEKALELAKEKSGNPNLTVNDIKQDEDVVDTWFSSWLWPISVFDGFDENSKDFEYYYPTNVLVTGWDIIFFWVARMIFAGLWFKNEIPFKEVYFTGMVRDKQRRKMSKSLGNSPDALALIEQYGADGVRFGMLSCSAAGNDLLFDESLCEQGRNFSNKIWNALRLIKSWKVDEQLEQPQYAKTADEWFTNIFFQQLEFINDCFSKYRISEALMSIYKLIWDDFCSWYLEIIKPGYEQPIDKYTMAACITNFENLLKLLHPFMPFVTEELWHQLKERNEDDYLIITEWPQTNNFSEDVINTYHFNQRFITAIRNERANKNISPKIKLNVFYHYLDDKNPKVNGAVVKKLENLEKIDNKLYEDQNTSIINVEKVQLFIPLEGMVDKEAEKEKLRKELTYLKGFLLSVDKKLSNERFVKNAPEQVVANEKKKKADAEIKIQNIEKQLASLN